MPTLKLSRHQVADLFKFCTKHDNYFFLAKDQGAYVGACGGNRDDDTFESLIFYFPGCDPEKDEDYYETARDQFGGDDFGETFEANLLADVCGDPTFTEMVFRVTGEGISISTAHSDLYEEAAQ